MSSSPYNKVVLSRSEVPLVVVKRIAAESLVTIWKLSLNCIVTESSSLSMFLLGAFMYVFLNRLRAAHLRKLLSYNLQNPKKRKRVRLKKVSVKYFSLLLLLQKFIIHQTSEIFLWYFHAADSGLFYQTKKKKKATWRNLKICDPLYINMKLFQVNTSCFHLSIPLYISCAFIFLPYIAFEGRGSLFLKFYSWFASGFVCLLHGYLSWWSGRIELL